MGRQSNAIRGGYCWPQLIGFSDREKEEQCRTEMSCYLQWPREVPSRTSPARWEPRPSTLFAPKEHLFGFVHSFSWTSAFVGRKTSSYDCANVATLSHIDDLTPRRLCLGGCIRRQVFGMAAPQKRKSNTANSIQIAQSVHKLIQYGSYSVIAFFICHYGYLSIAALAGRTTTASLLFSLYGILKAPRATALALSWLLTGSTSYWGYRERKGKKSSYRALTPNGSTRAGALRQG